MVATSSPYWVNRDGRSYTPFYGAAYAREVTSRHVILSLLHTMIELLQRADAVVVSDQAGARQLIDRVMDILHATGLCRLQLLDVSRKGRRPMNQGSLCSYASC